MEIKVRAVESVEKSKAEVEQELLDKAEQKFNEETEKTETQKVEVSEVGKEQTTTSETDAEIDNKIIADRLINGEFYYYPTDSDSAKPIRITAENVQEAIERNKIGDNIVNKKKQTEGELIAIIEVEGIEFRGIQELRDALDKYKEDYTEEELNAIKQELEKLTETKEVTPETEVEQSAREKMIEFNFDYIIKTLETNPITQGDEFLGKKKCD